MKLLRVAFLSLFLALAPCFAEGMDSEACTPVNLYDLPHHPFDRIPIYNQGEMSTCYAYTASQMIDFWRFNQDPDSSDLTSPLWTALIHKINVPIHWNPDSLDFSRMTWVFNSLERNGICRASVVNRAVERLRNGNVNLSEPDLMFFFQTLWDEYQVPFGDLKTNEAVYGRAYEKVAALPYFEGKIQYSLKDKFHFMTHYFKGQRLETLMDEVFSECKGEALLPVTLPSRESMGLGFASNRKFTRRIEKTLARDEPLGIGYCYKILDEGPGYRGIHSPFRFLGMALNQSECSAHYSMIVGQRPGAQGGCQYLIRNTYGTNFWTDHFSCLCQKKGSNTHEHQECRASDADAKDLTVLGCWIDSQDLVSNAFDLTYFK